MLACSFGFALAATGTSTVGAQAFYTRIGDISPTPNLSESQSAFAASYLAVIAGRDLESYKRLVHPSSLACMRKANEDFFANTIARRQGRTTAGPAVTVESLPPRLALAEAAIGIGLRFPVRPTHAFHIDLVTTASNADALVAFAVEEHGTWYEVLMCPSAQAVADFRAENAKAKSDSVKAQKLVKAMRDSVRAELVGLVKDGRTTTAVLRFADASGVEIGVARRVVEFLALEPISR
jgi:hypothetical protein